MGQKHYNKKKQDPRNLGISANTVVALMSCAKGICEGCGEPGHRQEKCTKAKNCFICKMVTHKVEDCPVRKKPHSTSKYLGSAATGLGYYHIDIPDLNPQHYGRLRMWG